MSKNRSGVAVLVLVMLLLSTPVLASERVVAPSPGAIVAGLWSEVVEVVKLVFGKSESSDELGPILDPNGDESGPMSDSDGAVDSPPDDELGPILDPNG